MNKRFFTLMAAALLAGAPFAANQAFAANAYYPTQAAAVNLATGVQFKAIVTLLWDNTNKCWNPSTLGTTGAITDEFTFTVTNYSNKTFGLTATHVATTAGGTTVKTTGVLKFGNATVFVAKNGASVAETTAFTDIYTYEFASAGTSVLTLNPYTTNDVLNNTELNANLSGNGFKLNFPGVAVQPEVNPFGDQMIAVAGTGSTVMFVVNDDAGKKFANDPLDTDKKNAATFIVVDPYANFGITGLIINNGEGFGFTKVKGEKLTAANNKAKGEINVKNAEFTVTESDQLNAADEFEIKVTPEIVQTDGTAATPTVYVGAYSLTAGGLKSYITTKSSAADLSKASTAGNTYVAAGDVLKASKEAAIYNIFFQGNDGSIGKSDSYYGKYLTLKADGDTAAYAPGYVDTKLAQAQWVVSNVGPKGVVTFKNVYNGQEAEFKLYKTATANVYQASFNKTFAAGKPVPTGAGEIKLIPATEGASFLTVTDAQLGREIDLTFVGSGAVTVSKIYPTISGDATSGYTVSATSDAKYAESWKFEKATEIDHVLGFKYLDGATIKDGESKCKVQTYYLKSTRVDKHAVSLALSNQLAAVATGSTAGATWGKYAFRKNANGTYTILNFAAPAPTAPTTPYEALVANTAGVWSVDAITTPATPYITNMAYNGSEYNTVVVDFEQLGESLPAASRHATFEGIDGGISMVDVEGTAYAIVTSNPLTFWLDTAESKAETPKFYISKGIAADEEETETKAAEAETRLFLHYAVDSLRYWDPNKAQYVDNEEYLNNLDDVIAIFRPAALVGVDTLATVKNGKEILVSKEAKAGVCEGGLGRFQFAITKDADFDAYVITNNAGQYLYNLNGVLAFTADETKAMLVTVGEGDPTANEAIEAEAGVQVIGGQGVVTVQGAAGKVVTVANILGQTIANQVAASDNVTIAAPAGIVVVAVDGEATKVIVK